MSLESFFPFDWLQIHANKKPNEVAIYYQDENRQEQSIDYLTLYNQVKALASQLAKHPPKVHSGGLLQSSY
jgi:acyl-coenzyme A synthetase/AMP-(fatty) acid ligase